MKKDTKIGFILTYFHNSNEGYEIFKKNVEILGRQNYYFVIASHSPLPQEIQEKCDFYFYQQKNVVDDRRYSHGVAENNLIEIALKHLKSQKIDWLYKVSYDIEINDVNRFLYWRKDYKYKFVSCNWGNNILSTHSFFANIDFVLNNIDFYNTIEEMFEINNVLENCWEKNIRDKKLENELFSYQDKYTFYGDNKIDILFYDYNEIVFTYSYDENRFYVTNNLPEISIKKFGIFDYYSDTLIDKQNDINIPPTHTFWFSPPFNHYLKNAINGFYIEVYLSDRTIRRNILIKDFDLKHPLSKKLNQYKYTEIKYNEFSEFHSLKIYENFDIDLKKIKTYIDVGANYGMSSIPFLTDNVKVYMIDPDSHNIKMLNDAFGKDNNVQIIGKAINSFDGFTDFYEQSGASVVSSIDIMNAIGYTEGRVKKKIECITPNTLIEKYVNEETIDLMKIDIEGSEYDFFQTITDENINKVSKFIIEYHMNKDYRVMSILKKLAKNDFRFKLDRWEVHNPTDYYVSHNMGIIYAWK
jgi:FkbM family methyltransferase